METFDGSKTTVEGDRQGSPVSNSTAAPKRTVRICSTAASGLSALKGRANQLALTAVSVARAANRTSAGMKFAWIKCISVTIPLCLAVFLT
jgi:hypothetical protein